MPVTVGQADRTVGHDRVEHLTRGCASGEVAHVPATSDDPLDLRVRCGVGRHARERVVSGVAVVQVAVEHVDPCSDRVGMGVLEAGDEQATLEVDHVGAAADERANLLVGADRRDTSAADRERTWGG